MMWKLGEWRGGEDLGGVGGEETIIRIQCLKKFFSIQTFEVEK